MGNCSQNFKKIFAQLTRKQAEGGDAFSPFLDISGQEIENLTEVLENISDRVMLALETSDEVTTYYDFNSAKNKLKEMGKKYPLLLSEDDAVINNLLELIKTKISKNNNKFLTNPLIEKDGEKVPMFDFSNLTELTKGISTMETFIDKELENGLFKAIFINNLSDYGSENNGADTYEPFVVTNTALNKNLNIYKNELWEYVVLASGLKAKDIIDSKLYINGKLNTAVFEPAGPNTPSPYVRVLSSIRDQMDAKFKSGNLGENIRIYNENSTTIAQAYLKTLILANFDNFLLSKHSSKVVLNLDAANSFALPSNNEDKYKLMFKWSPSIGYGTEMASDGIDKHSSNLVKMLADVIPYYEEVERPGRPSAWKQNDKKLTIGMGNLNSIGAILNDLDPNFTFKVSLLTFEKVETRLVTIGEAFRLYDAGKIHFSTILSGLSEAINQNDNLKTREAVLKSIDIFLYGKNGISKSFELWKRANPEYADHILNPEIALVNFIRNTVKFIYRKETLAQNGKTIDALNIETTVGKDFEELLENLKGAWKTKKVKPEDIKNIKSLENFLDFLKDTNKGGMIISDRAIERYKKLNPDINSKGFKEYLKLLFSPGAFGVKEVFDPENPLQGSITDDSLEGMIRKLKSPEVNAHLKLIELFKYKHYSEKYSIVNQIKDAEGNSIPTMGIANLASLYNMSLATAPENSFFKQNPNLFKGVEILLEVVGKENSIKADELNHVESFKLSFVRNYIMSSLNEDKVLIKPWNFSDKPKIFALGINANAQMSNYDKAFSKMNSSEFKEEFYNRQQNYYNVLINNVYNDVKLLDKNFFDTRQKTFKANTSLEKIKAMEDYLETLGTKDALLKAINKVFSNGDYVEIVEDLHYSLYDGKITFNQFLKSNVQIFNDKFLFNEFAKRKEQKLLSFYDSKINISLDQIILKNDFIKEENKIKELTKYFNISEEELLTEGKFIKHTDTNGNLSELLSRFLWSRNLIISQYANLTTKDVFFHPAKTKIPNLNVASKSEEDWNNYFTEENNRSIAFTKRMNIPGASMTIYGKGRYGIPQNIKVAAIEDPKAKTFNFTGSDHKQDVNDGGGKTNPFFNELLVWSLPGLDLKRTQKPIGESINAKFATTVKFAIFSITNEEIRNSALSNRDSYTTMQKMNNFNIYENEDKEIVYKNIMQIPGEGEINLSVVYNNLWVPINGEYKQVINLKHVEDNKYNLIYSNGLKNETKSLKIDTLFDLWEAFGGAYSARMEDGKLELTEDSIQIVSSIIKRHSIAGGMNLKDKMISMLLPQTAVKKGATNVNPGNILGTNKPLSYFNFDTSYFGVQLQSFHSTEDSETNEITQVISGIAENASTPELYNAVYNSIGTLVENGLKSFDITISQKDGLERIINIFVDKLNNSSQINNSRAIINGIEEELTKVIPLGNKTIYKQFISHIISSINSDFIRRKFIGSSSVLNPSHGVITVFESKNGIKYLAPDLLKLANAYLSPEKDLVFAEINSSEASEHSKNTKKIEWYLANSEEFKDDPINVRQIEPLDFIKLPINIKWKGKEVIAGEAIELAEIDDYYNIKELLEINNITEVQRTYTKPRDLKPVVITFKDDNGPRSLFDVGILKFSRKLQNNIGKFVTDNFISEDPELVDYYNFISSIVPGFEELSKNNKKQVLLNYSSRMVARIMDMLSANFIVPDYKELKTEENNPFTEMFTLLGGEVDNFTSRFDPKDIYIARKPIFDYVHKRAENVHSNVHKNSFRLGNTAMSEVDSKFFLNRIKQFTRQTPPQGTPYDLAMSNFNTEDTIFIALKDSRYYEKDGKLYDSFYNNEVMATKTFIRTKTLQDGTVVRINSYGEEIYKLPKNHTVFVDNNGKEILLVTKDDLEYFLKNLDNYDIVRFNDKANYKKNLLLTEENDTLMSLMKIVASSSSSKHLRRYINIKKASYAAFKKSLSDTELWKDPVMLSTLYTDYLKTDARNTFDNYIENLSKVIYQSWKFSNKALCARIPAQAMQSFQSMETVGYIAGDANDVYVSHWQLWLQGSDFDIDKLYMMMYEFKNGIFSGWSPFFDILKPNESFNLPIPNGRKYIHLDEDTKIDENNPPTNENTVDITNILSEDKSSLTNLLAVLLSLENNKEALYIKAPKKDIVLKINQHNKFRSESGFKNYIVYKLLSTSDHPSNQVASYSPISFGVYEDIKKELGNEYLLSMYDGYTMDLQQEQNSVGKKVIGIAATGLKNYFGLVKYFSEYYNNVEKEGIDKTSNGYFIKQIKLGKEVFTVSKISGINISKQSNNILKEHLRETLHQEEFLTKYGDSYTPEEIEEIIEKIIQIKPDTDAALNISSILSLATDNAKELMLAKINAGVDFASMHIYLAILGIDERTVAKFMTSPEAKAIKSKMNRDFFTDVKDISAPTKLDKLVDKNWKAYKKALITNPGDAAGFLDKVKEEEGRTGIDQAFLEDFLFIYKNAGELTSLGGLFKVNQGSKSTQEDLYKLVNQFKSIVTMQEKAFLKEFKVSKTEENYYEELIKFIVNDKPYLKGSEAYILGVLTKASKLNILNGEININKYFKDTPDGETYRQVVVSYYNLIKYTFNIFDVLNKLPHFYNMFKSFVKGDQFLTKAVTKYSFYKQVAPKVIELASINKEIDSYKINKKTRIFSSAENPILLNDDALNALNDYFDNIVISKFIKQLNYKLDLESLMDYLKIDEIILLKDNKRDIEETNPLKRDNLPYKTIDLSTEFGIAQFRYLMENYIIKHIKSVNKNNGFLKHYVFSTHKNFNLKNKINFYLDKSNFGELEDLEIGMSTLINRNNPEFDIPIKVTDDNKLENFKLIDLLYLYDLIINEGRFGGNRATIFFSKDISNKNSLSRKFVEFQRLVDGSSIFINDLEKELLDSADKRAIMFLKVFGEVINKEQDKSVILVTPKEPGEGAIPIIVNRYYSLLDGVENATLNLKSAGLAKAAINLIKNKEINIKIDCN